MVAAGHAPNPPYFLTQLFLNPFKRPVLGKMSAEERLKHLAARTAAFGFRGEALNENH